MEQLFTYYCNQHSAVMKKTIKRSKDLGTCSICWGEFEIQRKDGILHKHGHGGASGIPCTGSYKLSNPVTKVNIASSQNSQHSLLASPQSSNRVDNHTQASSNDDHSKRPPADNGGSGTSHLQHPKWRTLMNRVSKAARAQCATSFCDILTKISTDSTQLDS